ncbi:hypothetical protein D0869_01373 [Hortaea werneckii]|uniref:Uncharacterized protein n=1 Tax=Hortaea werneckii TaxID=91943 RepID=A0A3M6XD90_HORWE|nr:sterol glucosyltransferase [Hortaea werneckii]KAI7595953.1 sterol glucosyltransferase [Hortaea werneckii]RMX88783.1 hypothetical protein D0869_01373 [Hortaea werneckii]
MGHDLEAPPPYEEAPYVEAAAGLCDQAVVSDDGLIQIDLSSRLSRTLSRIVHLPPIYTPVADDKNDVVVAEEHGSGRTGVQTDSSSPPHLNIVIQVVGSRGDVQPFVALGTALQKYGHRVRLATHENFRQFVRDAGLEFWSIGGDPEELMSYMVKNPGLVPSMSSLKAGDVGRKRAMIRTFLDGCWKSCIESDGEPFVADAIIANPPSFAHIHCAEALGIPLHMVFTMPWTGTRSFSHPLANMKNATTDPNTANYLSFVIVEWMTWQGLGDVINDWRCGLDLEPIPMTEGPTLVETLRIPHTYCWSSALVPKPADWPGHIDVSGFLFRDAPDYKPPKDLEAFLDAGQPPIYIGFGSIVLDDAKEMSSLIIDAVNSCGVRAVVSRGWSRLDGPHRPDIFWLEDCPHEWLFQHVFAVVHHGGAGTTACGLLNARPTAVVPFFGDQAFWGNMVATAGAGPSPIPHRQLNAQNLAEAIDFCRSDAAQTAAANIATQIQREDGVEAAVQFFHANLPLDALRCDILSNQPAALSLRVGGQMAKISKKAVAVIVQDGHLNHQNLKIYRPKAIVIENRRWDPVTGTASSFAATITGVVDASTGIFLKPADVYRRGRSRRPTPASSRSSSSQPTTGSKNLVPDQETIPSADDFFPKHQPTDNDVVSLASSNDKNNSKPRSGARVAGKMAAASGKSLGKVFTSYTKGVLVDLPLATAEGFRNMPRLWGDEVKDYGKVTDWKSGGVTAGKSLVLGIGQGFRDMAMEPVKGGRDGGAWGATRGVARGTASLLTKTASGCLGLVAYPGQGLSKSLYTHFHSDTSKAIVEAKRTEGKWLMENMTLEERSAIINRYYDMLHKGK